MAKVTAPLLSFGAGGQVGQSIVFAKWKGRPYTRRYVVPSNPNTVSQQTTRNTFSSANAIWKTAPPQFISPWDAFASGQVLTGRNAFVGRFVKDLRGEADLLLMPFSPGALAGPAPASVAAASGVGEIVVTVTPPVTPTGWVLSATAAAAIEDGDPAALTSVALVVGEEVTGDITLTGLTAAQLYVVGGWTIWARPDGRVAYGPSLNDSATPT